MAPPAISEWTRRVYSAADARDASAFVQFLSDDVWVRFGNAPPVVGREAVRASFAEFFAGIRGMRHEFTGEWRGRDRGQHEDTEVALLEADVTYMRADGRAVTVPAFTAFRLVESGGEVLASRVQIFMDVSPIFAAEATPVLCRTDKEAVVYGQSQASIPENDVSSSIPA